MDRQREREPRAVFEPNLYNFAPRLRDVEGAYQFGHQCIDVFFSSASNCPEPEVRQARRSNSHDYVDHHLWVIHGVERLEDDVRGAFVAKLCFRAEEFSARLRELGPQGECQLTRNLLHLFLLGGRLHLDVAIADDYLTPLSLDLSYRRVAAH